MSLSILIETPVALLLGPRRPRTALASVAATLITHPILWAVWFPLRDHLSWAATAALLEGAVVLVEAVVYRVALGVSWGRALLISAAANAASFGLGQLIL
jgi:hypothetical protein